MFGQRRECPDPSSLSLNSSHAEAMGTSSPSRRQCLFLQRAPVREGCRRRSNWGESVCPKCFAKVGDRHSEVVAEFEVDQLASVFSALWT